MRFILGLPTDDVGRRAEFGTVEAVTEMARAAERLGYDGVYVTDHPIPPQQFIEHGGHHALEPTVVLAVAAAATTRLRLMTNLYIVAYRNPFLAAKAIASLDSLSDGRVILGTGAGYLEPEFRALGADFDARNDRLDDALVLMKQVWSGEVVDVEGPGFAAHAHVALPTPAAVPHPPIWVGGNTGRALRRVAAHGSGWIPMPAPRKFAKFVRSAPLESLDDLRTKIATLHELTAEIERDGPIDVMFAPMGLAPYGHTAFDASAYVDGLGELATLGVTYSGIAFSHPGSGGLESRSQFLDLAEGFARDVMAAT
jgi:probable F420-dependent oxidoreductase